MCGTNSAVYNTQQSPVKAQGCHEVDGVCRDCITQCNRLVPCVQNQGFSEFTPWIDVSRDTMGLILNYPFACYLVTVAKFV